MENLCAFFFFFLEGGGDFNVRPDLSHLPSFFSAAEWERNNRMLPDSEGGRATRVRKSERGKIELPLPHIGNINPSFERKERKKEDR